MDTRKLWPLARICRNYLAILAAGALACPPAWGAVAPESPWSEQEEAWLESDDWGPPAMPEVNGGELEFLSPPPHDPVHHYINRVQVTSESLHDGWVILEQCHRHLDPVPRVQVVFDPDRTKELRVTSSAAIGRAWVEGATIQLENVSEGAHLCLLAKSRALAGSGANYVLENGPFMRRFLDGYYPMHVSMLIHLDAPGLELVDTEPTRQPGFSVSKRGDAVRLDTWFTGRLTTRLLLRQIP